MKATAFIHTPGANASGRLPYYRNTRVLGKEEGREICYLRGLETAVVEESAIQLADGAFGRLQSERFVYIYVTGLKVSLSYGRASFETPQNSGYAVPRIVVQLVIYTDYTNYNPCSIVMHKLYSTSLKDDVTRSPGP